MNSLVKYFLILIALILVVFFCWFFSSIIGYILIAAVISFLGKPIIDLLGRIKIRGKAIPNGGKAAITLLTLWGIFIFFFVTLIPLVIGEFQNLENVSIANVLNALEIPLLKFGKFLAHYGFIDDPMEVRNYLSVNLSSVIDMANIGSAFGSIADRVAGIFIALFAITFITFFFLKDNNLFKRIVLAILPERHAEGANHALDSIQRLLVRYFGGIIFEIIGVMSLNTFGLWLVGLDFSNALVIGLVTGILNVIPYIGPIIGVVFGTVVGIVLNLDLAFYTELLPLLIYMIIAMVFTQLIDNFVFQPLIYGTSVYAHPLEIFIVILMAGKIGGIPGMILAIPAYTVLRVVLKEFFSNYRLVKKITYTMDREMD